MAARRAGAGPGASPGHPGPAGAEPTCHHGRVNQSALDFYATPGRLTALDDATLDDLGRPGPDIARVVEVVQGLLVYDLAAQPFYGVELTTEQAEAIHERATDRLLDLVRNPRPPPPGRSPPPGPAGGGPLPRLQPRHRGPAPGRRGAGPRPVRVRALLPARMAGGSLGGGVLASGHRPVAYGRTPSSTPPGGPRSASPAIRWPSPPVSSSPPAMPGRRGGGASSTPGSVDCRRSPSTGPTGSPTTSVSIWPP